MNLGSLVDEDVRRLRTWDLLRTQDEEETYDEYGEEQDTEEQIAQTTLALERPSVRGMINRGTPWFEDMIENSALGRVRRQKGGYEAPDGSESLYWEVVELAPDGSELPVEQAATPGSGKRKREEGEGARAEASGDVHMRD